MHQETEEWDEEKNQTQQQSKIIRERKREKEDVIHTYIYMQCDSKKGKNVGKK